MMSKYVKTSEQSYSENMYLFKSLMASIWSHCKTFHCYYKHCYQIFCMYRLDFILLLLLLKLFALCLLFVWLDQLIHNVTFNDCFMNVSWWNVVNYNLTYTSNSPDSPCFAQSKLVESSERSMLLLLLFCILQSSFYETWLYVEALWKYVKAHFSITWLLHIKSQKQRDTSAGDDEPLNPTNEIEKWQPLGTDFVDMYRSIDTKRAQTQMSKGLSFGHDNHKTLKKAKTEGLTLETGPYSLSHQDTDTQPSGDDSEIMQSVEQGQSSKVPVKGNAKKSLTDPGNFNQLSLQKACIIFKDKLYANFKYLISLPCASKVVIDGVVKSYSSSEDDLPNVDATSVREHFISHKNKAGYILFRSDKSFSGAIWYPLPKKNAQVKRIGYGNVFKMYHDNKTYAVKKMLRSEGAYIHSQLYHCNIINLEAILVGEKHEHRKDKHYIYCFMPEMDIDFRKLLLSNECGSLKDVKMQTVIQDWKNVMSNVKHVLRSLLKALQYMHSQGYSHSGIKLDNVLIKMLCHCEKEDLLYCTCCQQNFAVKLAGFSSAVSCDSFYSTKIDIWSFGCFLLDSFIGKYRTTEKTFEELPFYLSVEKDQYRNLEEQLNELLKYYSDTPGLCDLVQECLQVDPDWRPTAEELSQSEFLE